MTEEILAIMEETTVEESPPTILRTSEDGTWEVYHGPWGSYLRPCSDPEANVVITKDHLLHFEVKEGIHRIPSDLWARWIRLCFYFVDKVPSQMEVSVRFLRNATNPAEYRAVVPKQKVTAASVKADNFDECIDLVTGEEFTSYPPEGWVPVGSSHSHNTMGAFFSAVDDRYELGDPGIHLTVGKIDTKSMRYEIAASVTGNNRRFKLPYADLIDATPVEGVTFHEDVIKYVDYTTPVSYGHKSSPVVRAATSNILKKLPPAKENPVTKKNYSSYQEYCKEKYGLDDGDFDPLDDGDFDPEYKWEYRDTRWQDKYNDPFYFNDSFVDVTESAKDVPVIAEDIYPIIDLLEDYLKQNRNDSDALDEMKQQLAAFLIGLEIEMCS
jgi:hypothetical protein